MPTPNASVVVKIGALMDSTVGAVFGKTTSGLKKIGDTMKDLASRSQEMKRLDAASVRLGESVEALTGRYEKQSGTLAKAEARFAAIKEKITAAGGADEKLATQLTRADEAVTRARLSLDRTNVSLAKAKTDYTGASAAAETFRAANQHVESSLNQLGAAMKRYESASAALQANEAKRAEYRSKMLGVLAAGYAIRKTVEKAAEGEEAGLKLKWSLDGGDARHQIGSIIEQTRAIAARTMATAPELFRIQAVLNRESLSADESRIASETIHKVAAVTGQDATETAKAIASIYNTVGLQMVGSTQQKLARIGDLATAMQQRFAIDDIGSLGAGLAKALPQATMARVSFEQTGAAIGALTRHGLDAGAAGQQMSAVLINMTKASKQLGFQLVHDAKGNLDFEGTILAMQARLNRMGGLERNRDALTKAFSRRGAGAAFLLMEAAATGDLTKAQNALANSTGTVDQEYKELEDSAKGMLLRITKAFNETLLPIGRALLPGLKTVLEPIGKLATWVGGFLEKHKTLAAWLGGITTTVIAMTAAVYAGGYAWAFLHGGWLRAGKLLEWLKLKIVAHRLEVLADAGAEETAAVATESLAVAETTGSARASLQPDRNKGDIMNASVNCLRLIEGSEGCELKAYPCPSGIPTIGYGHTASVRLGMTCTPAQASAWLCEDVHYAENLVQEHVKVALTQDQFDALVSILFNVGPGAKGEKDGIIVLANGQISTLLRKLNAGDYAGAAEEFPKWCHGAGGASLGGLATRRARERALFLGVQDYMLAA